MTVAIGGVSARGGRSVALDFLRYGPSQVLPSLAAVVVLPILTRSFAPASYGEYALAVSAVGALLAVTSGLQGYVVRFYAANDGSPTHLNGFLSLVLSLAVTITLAIGVLFAAGVQILGPFESASLHLLLLLAVLVFAVTALFTTLCTVFRSERRAGAYTFLQLLQAYGSLGLGLFLALRTGAGVAGLLLGTLAVTCAAALLAWVVLRQRYDLRLVAAPVAQTWDAFRYVFFVSAGNVIYWVLNLSDRWLVGVMRGPAEAGVYAVSYDLASKPLFISIAAMSLALGPILSQLWERSGRAGVEELLPTIARLYIALMLPAAVGLAVLAETILRVMASAKYDTGYVVMPVVAAGLFLYGLSFVFGRAYPLVSRPDLETRNYIAAGALNVALNILLVPVLGYPAAAITTAVGYLALLLLHYWFSRRYLTWRFPLGTLVRCGAASGLMALAVVACARADGSIAPLLRLASEVGVGALVYLIGLVVAGELPVGLIRQTVLPLASRASR
jgi:O-antigen/teichoic acid export membrane protein